MTTIDTSSASRRATLTRLALTCVLGLPIGFVALLYAGSGPVGMLFAIPALYLLWVLGADAVALVRGARTLTARGPGTSGFSSRACSWS